MLGREKIVGQNLMKKVFKFGCLGILGIIVLLVVLVAVAPKSNETAQPVESRAESQVVIAATEAPTVVEATSTPVPSMATPPSTPDPAADDHVILLPIPTLTPIPLTATMVSTETSAAIATQTSSPTAPVFEPEVGTNAEQDPADLNQLTAGQPQLPEIFTNANANLRGGPGIEYPVLGSTMVGQPLIIVAQNTNGDWLRLDSGMWIARFLVDEASGMTWPVDNTVLAQAVEVPAPLEPTVQVVDYEGEYVRNLRLGAAKLSYGWGKILDLFEIGEADPQIIVNPDWKANLNANLDIMQQGVDSIRGLQPAPGYEEFHSVLLQAMDHYAGMIEADRIGWNQINGEFMNKSMDEYHLADYYLKLAFEKVPASYWDYLEEDVDYEP